MLQEHGVTARRGEKAQLSGCLDLGSVSASPAASHKLLLSSFQGDTCDLLKALIKTNASVLMRLFVLRTGATCQLAFPKTHYLFEQH